MAGFSAGRAGMTGRSGGGAAAICRAGEGVAGLVDVSAGSVSDNGSGVGSAATGFGGTPEGVDLGGGVGNPNVADCGEPGMTKGVVGFGSDHGMSAIRSGQS